jgi:hypothetical protein
MPARLEIDKLPDGRYRATVGTLFEHQEICRTGDLEALVRQANAMASCRSFDDVAALSGRCGRSVSELPLPLRHYQRAAANRYWASSFFHLSCKASTAC